MTKCDRLLGYGFEPTEGRSHADHAPKAAVRLGGRAGHPELELESPVLETGNFSDLVA
jgi:hypothetical protein